MEKSYIVYINGERDRCVWTAESEQEVRGQVMETFADMEEEDRPSDSDIIVEELAHRVILDSSVTVLDEAYVAIEACDNAPAGYHDSPDDDTHTTYTYFFGGRYGYRAVAYITNWEPDLFYDLDGESGSFDIDHIVVERA